MVVQGVSLARFTNRSEKIRDEDHGSLNFVFSNHENKQDTRFNNLF